MTPARAGASRTSVAPPSAGSGGNLIRAAAAQDGMPAPEGRARLALVRGVALLTLVSTFSYLAWRVTETLPDGPALWIGVPFLALELYGGIALVLFVMTTWNVAPAVVPPPAVGGGRPTVTVLIATYDEHLDVLLPTVAACLAMEGEHETWVLDDGDRLEVAEMVTALGARYVSRPEHEHAKAGNLNHALGLVRTDLIAVFDADHVPDAHFLPRTLPYFADSRVALVQTPQHFYNTSSFEHLRPGVDLHEESLFYRVIQAGKHHAGAAFWCGTNAVLRVDALRSIGGVATESLTEDFHTTMKLHRTGWRTTYHNEVLARGLAAGGPAAFYAQRRRWGRGAMQVLRLDNPLTVSGLTVRQRLGYLYSLMAWFDSWRTLGLTLIPVAVLLTGIFPVDADPRQFVVLAGGAFVLQLTAQALLSRGFAPLRFSLLFEVVRMPSNLAATLSLVQRGTGRFAVTAKGRTGDSRVRAHVPVLLIGLAVLFIGTLVYAATTYTGWTPTRYPAGGTVVVPVVCLAVSTAFLIAGIWRIRDPRFSTERREAHRFGAHLLATVNSTPARLLDVSLGGAQVRIQGAGAAVGRDVSLAVSVPDRAEPVVFRATVRHREGELHRLQFVGRQWIELAALSATAFGAGAARWAAVHGPTVHGDREPVVRITAPVPVPPARERVEHLMTARD